MNLIRFRDKTVALSFYRYMFPWILKDLQNQIILKYQWNETKNIFYCIRHFSVGDIYSKDKSQTTISGNNFLSFEIKMARNSSRQHLINSITSSWSMTSSIYKNNNYVFKYVVVGDNKVGKSCLIKQFVNKEEVRN